MYKLVFELLTDPLGLPINALWEYLILLIIGAISFSVGWEVSPGGRFGSLIHWGARLIAFFTLWAITYGVISAFQWIIAHWLMCVAVLVGITVVIIAVILIRKSFPEKWKIK